MDFPAATTTLYGRDDELDQIALHLNDPDHRLVSLVGPGGIGKTSLGIEAARRYGDRTKDGCVLVDLQAVDQHELVLQRLADALQLSIQNRQSALDQIIQFLRGKETLLYFDNFEQVIEAAPIVTDLLAKSPGTTALVTSRIPLRVTQEWILNVDGLAVPELNATTSTANNASIQLFIDRATKVRPDLSVEQNMSAIEQICQIVEGMPLAIEIAASWAHILECSEIAEELQRDHALLESNMRDVPDRHRSIDTIFAQSMNMLEPAQITGFEKLSIFRGGFTRDAAIKVAGASIVTISALADLSLVRLTENGRYRIHELVRQFGADQLSQDNSEQERIEQLHSAYYLEFLGSRQTDLTVKKQVKTAHEIESESENIRISWNYAVEHGLAPSIAGAVTAYGQFIQYRGQYAAGGHTFASAVQELRTHTQDTETEKALALLLLEHGRFSLRQGNLDQAQQAYTESDDLHKSLNLKPHYGLLMDPQLGFAYLDSTRGNIQQAINHAEQVLNNATAQKHTLHVAMANQLLGHLALRRRDLIEARKFDQTALASCIDQGENWFIAYCHNELGEVDIAEGDFDAATEHFTQSLSISQTYGDRANVGLAQVCLGEVATLAGRFNEAAQLFEESKNAYEQLGDRGGAARAQSGLGALAVATSSYVSAYHHLKEVLETATDMQFSAMILDSLEVIGELALKTDSELEGHQLLDFVAQYESTDSRTRARLKAVFDVAETNPDLPGSIEEHVEIARGVLQKFSADNQAEISVAASIPVTANSAQQLAEPLTERELEILERIAEGLPNQQIADELFISLGTVKWYNNQIYTKLGVHNRTSAVAKATDLSLISPTAPN